MKVRRKRHSTLYSDVATYIIRRYLAWKSRIRLTDLCIASFREKNFFFCYTTAGQIRVTENKIHRLQCCIKIVRTFFSSIYSSVLYSGCDRMKLIKNSSLLRTPYVF